jgi:hypothetical protein
MKFDLFDTVKLKEAISLTGGPANSDQDVASEGTLGVIVEVYNQGEAYEVELFGGWVKYDEQDLIPATREDPDSFTETIGVETLYPHQIHLVKPAHETVGIRAQLLAVIDELSDNNLEQVKDFAEFLKQKHRKTIETPS